MKFWFVFFFSLMNMTALWLQGSEGNSFPQEVASLMPAPDLVYNLWPATPPGDESVQLTAEEWSPGNDNPPIIRVSHVAIPTLSLYKAKNPNGTCVVIFPGGGYNILAYNHEGTEVAQWLNGLGITAVVVKYRVPRRDGRPKHLPAFQDAQRAMRMTRSFASEWGIDANKIGVLGFSAGGHLVVMTATHYDEVTYSPIDQFDSLSCRPDFLIPIYPAYMMENEKEMQASVPLADEVTINANTPPAFLSVTDDDVNRAAASARFYLKMREANVPCELHIFVKGGHGYGLRQDRGPAARWDISCEAWLKAMNLL